MEARDIILVMRKTSSHTTKADRVAHGQIKVNAPTPQATPFPLLKCRNTDQSFPTMAAVAHASASSGVLPPIHTARTPFRKSQINNAAAAFSPSSL